MTFIITSLFCPLYHCIRLSLTPIMNMRTILIIDDHKDIRENIAEILSLDGYKTLQAEDGRKGVELAIANKPDLIVCDIMMPELDGYGVLHLLKKNVDTQDIPFVFLTAKAERSDFRKGMDMGADDYITKPFDDFELLNAIETRLKKQDVLKSKFTADNKGVNELMKQLHNSGLLKMDLDSYDTHLVYKKQLLYSEGKRPKYLYYLKSGQIKTFQTNDDGKEYITNLYAPGDFIGYVPLLEEKNYEDSAEALKDSEVAIIPREEFVQLVFNDINIATKFIKLITINMKEKETRLLNLAYDSLRKRIAKALVDIHNKFNKDKEGQTIDISRDDIAHYVGTATESLIRTLSDFKSEGLIEIKSGKINIINVAKLSDMLY